MILCESQETEYEFLIDSDLVCLCFPRVVFSAAKLHLMLLSLFFFFFFFPSFLNLLKRRHRKWWNVSFPSLFFLFSFTKACRLEEQGDRHKHWENFRNTKKNNLTEWYDLVSKPSFDTTRCEPRDHATRNKEWDLISECRKRSERSVTQWKPTPRHQHY